MNRFALTILLLFSLITLSVAQSADSVILKQGLMIKLNEIYTNKVIASDVVAALVETEKFEAPKENEPLKFNDEQVGVWKKIVANDNGWFINDTLYNAYVYLQYKSDKNDIILLEAMGHSVTYVNGVAHSGNPYRTQDNFESWGPRFDYSLIPVKVNKGNNDLLFGCNRAGVLKVKIHTNKKGLYFVNQDLTSPDIIIGEAANTFGAIPIINATDETLNDLSIKTWSEGSAPEYYSVKQINPVSIFKTPFVIKLPSQNNQGKIKFNIELVRKDNTKDEVLASTVIELNVLPSTEKHKETFISNLDGSVQYYGVTPAVNLPKGTKPALFLSLHGAGVEAINQAQAYNFKNWGYIVCPTNRRPYGYNWENWGRLDGLEVYSIAKKKFNIDNNRVYLTGHSMGGHGTWQLGINYPDKFAALGPSAGWISIWSYRIRPTMDSSDIKKMLLRSTKHSDTYAFTTNLKPNGIYILHGDADDNVPPEQARSMVENLSKFHKDFIFYEEPGVGHWWDNSDEPGADCVDWMPMFDFFSHHSVPDNNKVRSIDFVTANLAITSSNYWVEILNQVKQQMMSRINIHLEPGNRKFVGTTSNILRMTIDASMLTHDAPVSVNLDDQLIADIKLPADNKIYLYNNNGKWEVSSKQGEENKYPGRLGNFREVLNNNVVFVYGTNGSKDENKWAYEKARYDAEKIWYQGNGSIEIITDEQFDATVYKDRNVVLFGNSETNSAWTKLLKDSPVQIDNKKIKIGDKEIKGKDLACLMIRPRTDSKIASVAVVAGTGLEGMRLSNLAQHSHPYLSFPDVVVYNSGVLQSDEKGVKFVGYFGNDWSLQNGEFINQ
ncbi:MAG: alpha/beta hydrolase [Ignavibacteriales bacterium]|nr:MAG: alpha/beta hydrolase [Ignavibacteriales bacterium]